MFVFYQHLPRKKIEHALTASQNQYEQGGLLVGYRLFSLFAIVDLTVAPSSEQFPQISFTLDGKLHEALVTQCIAHHWPSPTILGVWHSHTQYIDHFSSQDRIANAVMAQALQGTLSALVLPAPFSWQTYYISMDGRTQPCKSFFFRRYSDMNQNNRCSMCIYWQHRKCTMTGEIKNDSICTCGQFSPRTPQE